MYTVHARKYKIRRERKKKRHTCLLVIQFSGQRESSRVRVHVEHVVGPVAYHRVRDHPVHALVLVHGRYVADFRASGRGLTHVQRVHVFRERRRVVVGVQYLNARKACVT